MDLYGNIWRKYWTYTRDIERKKRCVFVPDIDEETGNIIETMNTSQLVSK